MAASDVQAKSIWVYDPVADEDKRNDELAQRLMSVDGKVIGLVDNTKDLVEVLLGEVKSLLQHDYPKAVFRYFRKPSVSGASPDLMEQIATCDAVVAAVGD
jgi:hypothetical protein